MSRSSKRALVAGALAAVFFAAAIPWALRPWFLSANDLPSDSSRFAPMENADLLLNVWILGWVARASTTDPAALFDGNIYYPASNTLALSENMLAHVPVTAPVFALTGSVLDVLKAMVFESFLLAALGMFALVYAHTRNPAAALVAGAAYAFAPWRVHGLPHPQYLATGYIPLAFLAVDLWLDRRRLRSLAGLAAMIALQILACLYLGYFIAFGVAAYAGARLLATHERPLRAGFGIAAGAAVGALVALPVALPYLRARRDGIVPPFDPTRFVGHAWAPWDYVSVAFVELAGVAVLAIVVVDLLARAVEYFRGQPIAWSAREWALWAVVGVAVLLSTGPYVLLPGGIKVATPYLLFYDWLPGFSAVRGPRRFFIVVLAGLAALAGHSFARWTARLPGWAQIAAGVAAATACVVVAAPRPAPTLSAELGHDAAPVYAWLAAQPGDGAVLEIPGSAIEGDFVGATRNARYMLASTQHWRPLVNGYSGYEPPSASLLATAIRKLPAPDALAFLVDSVDVRWIVLHRALLVGNEQERWQSVATPGLELVARFGDDEVYAVTRMPERPWRDKLRAGDALRASETWSGVSTAPLPERCRTARILAVETPPVIALTAFPVPIPVRFENASPCPWPAVAVSPEGLVGFTYRWTDPVGSARPEGAFSRLIADVPAGATLEEPVVVIPPFGEPGTWQLTVRLVQRGTEEALAEQAVPVEVKVLRASPGRLLTPAIGDGEAPLPTPSRGW